MNIKHFIIFSIAFLMLSFGLPKHLQKKIDKEIKSTFNIEKFTFNALIIHQNIAETLPSKFGADNFFEIKSKDSLLGYAYVSKAWSKADTFDYLVLLDSDLVIMKAKVLIYREDYGGEIGSRRWLKQFIGKTQNDDLRYGDNIAAISGATISVRAMTSAINDLLKSLKIVYSKKSF